MLLAGVEDEELINGKFLFWENVYGFDMSAMAGDLHEDAYVDHFKADSVITNTCTLKVFYMLMAGTGH